MNPQPSLLQRSAFYVAGASAAASLFSIAVCQILLAFAIALLLVSGQRLRFPPIKVPLALFFAATVLSMALSADPSLGRPQIRKFFVWAILLVVLSTFRGVMDTHRMVWIWGGIAALSAMRALVQFSSKLAAARALGQNFYQSYVGDRITGFMSHWMTFSGQMMIVLLMLSALLLFSPLRRWAVLFWTATGVMLASIVLGFTRSIWLATGVALVYLIARWRPKWLIVVPLILTAGYWLAPQSVRRRAESLYQPQGTDSNQHRVVTWRTGWEMIKAHPLLGVGPEHVNPDFKKYVPAEIPQPLPTGWYGHLHSIYLHYAAERGIPALVALLWLLGRILYDFTRGLRAKPGPERRAVLEGAVAVMLAILVEGFFELNLGDSEVLTLFLAVTACGYVALDVEEAAPVA